MTWNHTSPHMPSAVDIRNVSKSFGRGAYAVEVLKSVSVEIAHKEFFTLLGPSGCGKTTLLRLIAGFEAAQKGQILIDGVEMSSLPPFQRPVNTVFQSYSLFPHLTVAQNVAFGLEGTGASRSEVKRRVGEALEMVRMGDFECRKPSELSGGQQQRVALARALAPRPKVLLLDEPLSALDLKLRKQMQIELKQLQEEAGITFVFVTHDQEEALTLSDRVAVMHQGRILQLDDPRTIYEHPSHRFVADFIGDINFLEGRVDTRGVIALKCGAVLADSRAGATHGDISVAIRPERAKRVPTGQGNVDGTLIQSVYLGTGLLHQLRLPCGSVFLLREAAAEAAPLPAHGGTVGIELPAAAISVFAS
ncbi:ABC transporter ATP-binding protein [Roseovarius aestuarii]|nr:ABC transporter ATP-binding protein [Roseovarius aestuarii]